ncbi:MULTISPECIES: aminoglycoside adenylyltransferase domain-containing protein [Heyndrickxia]|uniref:aminoglycoside adenylyltransferase domain-containing protein n=1 Tax=Heyndrickxia TaxID=2837504 RepID=UPI000D39280E|nr:aminoglycoside adenylyltransferase domain-containing protein [Heyndrickxia sporothermodurans]
MSVEKFLEKVCSLFDRQLGSNLVGVYLHGSLAMGCFQPDKSDVDVLVIVKEKLCKEQKKNLIQDILTLEEYKLEMSILLENYLVNFRFPTPFELHYSQMHREKYLQDSDYLCGDSVDPDLAAHLVVTYERGICLFGKPVREVFYPIERTYYIQSILFDVEDAVEEIVHQPVYYILNLCRVLYYLSERVVSSKKEGGEWGKRKVINRYKPLVSQALSRYLNEESEQEWDPVFLQEFAVYMVKEVSKWK